MTDIKPSNLLLRHGEVDRVTLIDFGIARRARPEKAITKTGFSVGTPAYMAPEQTRGEREITAAADIFALGCVIYECLTGEPLYMDEYSISMYDEVPYDKGWPLQVLCPDIPEQFEALLTRMCAASVVDRPQDGTALLEELEAISTENLLPDQSTSHAVGPVELGPLALGERLLLAMVVAVPLNNLVHEGQTVDFDLEAPTDAMDAAPRAMMQRVVRRYGAQGRWLSDGTFMAVITQAPRANDLLRRAVDCSLALQSHWPGARLAIASGFGESATHNGSSSLLTRALALAYDSEETEEEEALSSRVRMDALSASLSDVFLSTEQSRNLFLLKGKRLETGELRTLCGNVTSCVGRERELGELDAVFRECSEDTLAQAVLILGPSGSGKSRLRHEFLRRLRASGQDVTLLIVAGDMNSRSILYRMIGQAVRQLVAADVLEQQEVDADTLRSTLQLRLKQHLSPAEAPLITQALSRLCGLAPSDDSGPQTPTTGQGARAEEQILSHAFVRFLAVESKQRPVLLILEDLQWADSASLQLVDAALRELKEHAVMVLALGRPEVGQDFPKLWEGRRLQTIELKPLSKKASENLVRQALGPQASQTVVSHLVGQAAGNALYLEELILLAGKTVSSCPSEALVAIGHVRLMGLDPEARRILRVASVFGPTFFRGGLIAVLGLSRRLGDLTTWLSVLTDAELLELRPESSIVGDDEYGWRQDLLREAAENALLETDRALLRHAVAQWFEQVGEHDRAALVRADAEKTTA